MSFLYTVLNIHYFYSYSTASNEGVVWKKGHRSQLTLNKPNTHAKFGNYVYDRTWELHDNQASK